MYWYNFINAKNLVKIAAYLIAMHFKSQNTELKVSYFAKFLSA